MSCMSTITPILYNVLTCLLKGFVLQLKHLDESYSNLLLDSLFKSIIISMCWYIIERYEEYPHLTIRNLAALFHK